MEQAGSLNPLHCGAVVASAARRDAERAQREGLNPLHCGAVVASETSSAKGTAHFLVLIPFIAGQWSLRRGGGADELPQELS